MACPFPGMDPFIEDREWSTFHPAFLITALETMYRDALAAPGATPLNADRPVLTSDPRACVRALEACRRARQALAEHNPNEGLLLEWLLSYFFTRMVADTP